MNRIVLILTLAAVPVLGTPSPPLPVYGPHDDYYLRPDGTMEIIDRGYIHSRSEGDIYGWSDGWRLYRRHVGGSGFGGFSWYMDIAYTKTDRQAWDWLLTITDYREGTSGTRRGQVVDPGEYHLPLDFYWSPEYDEDGFDIGVAYDLSVDFQLCPVPEPVPEPASGALLALSLAAGVCVAIVYPRQGP